MNWMLKGLSSGSLLAMWRVAEFDPVASGAKRTVNVVLLVGATCAEGVEVTPNAAAPHVPLGTVMRATMIGMAVALSARAALAQTAKDVRGATPLVAIENEPPPKLIVDPPVPEQLALGRVFIQYRTENLRILPVFNRTALSVSPRVGHLHYKVDGQTWPIVDTSGETVVLVGLPPGPHKIVFELADPTHKPITSQTVEFTIPATKTGN